MPRNGPALDSYPEHAKVRLIKDNSQLVGSFLEWLESEGYLYDKQ